MVGCHKPPEQNGIAPNFVLPVTIVEATPSSIPITAEAVGQTEGAKEVEIRPRVGGILLKRKYSEGSAVKAGQTMFGSKFTFNLVDFGQADDLQVKITETVKIDTKSMAEIM